jgi:methylmalonyl-CoA epimerase
MKILGIEHIGIAVKDIDKNTPFWKHVLGLTHTRTEEVASQKVKTAIFQTGRGKIELLEATDSNSPIAKYLEKRSPGVHHVCLQVDNIRDAIKELMDDGVEVINPEPRIGAEGHFVAFIHPRSTGGVLVELAERR